MVTLPTLAVGLLTSTGHQYSSWCLVLAILVRRTSFGLAPYQSFGVAPLIDQTLEIDSFKTPSFGLLRCLPFSTQSEHRQLGPCFISQPDIRPFFSARHSYKYFERPCSTLPFPLLLALAETRSLVAGRQTQLVLYLIKRRQPCLATLD
jgi:hypothetical protein